MTDNSQVRIHVTQYTIKKILKNGVLAVIMTTFIQTMAERYTNKETEQTHICSKN